MGDGAAEPPATAHNQITGATFGPVVQAHTITGGVHFPRAPVIPRQLPPAPRWFAGRDRELATLGTDTGVISAIAGTGGIGKTSLALHWAHQHLDLFPDGQLFIDLQGFAPTGNPTPAGVAIRAFLDAFAVDPESIPVDLAAQVGRYRSLVADRRMLIVLDNARDTGQVAPLLPGSGTCTVIITSRTRMDRLFTGYGAHTIPLDVLAEDESTALLVSCLGAPRVSAEPDAVAGLVARCGGLPLALAVVAGRANAHPRFPLSVLADELTDTLDADDPDTNLGTVLSWSYAALDPAQAASFHLLGMAPGPDIGVPAAASLFDQPTARARATLAALERASLVREHVPGRYRMHDLVRRYAAELPGAGAAALHRLADFYLHTACGAERVLAPRRPPIDAGEPVPGCRPLALPDVPAVLAWFDAEHACLLAQQRFAAHQDRYLTVHHLASALGTFHARRGHVRDDVTVWRAGLAAARHLDDDSVLAQSHRHLAAALTLVDSDDEAIDHFERALALTERAGDLLGQGHTHTSLARWIHWPDPNQGLAHAVRAVDLFDAAGSHLWRAHALTVAGGLRSRLGDHTAATADCSTALALFQRHGGAPGEAAARNALGDIATRTGDHTDALAHHRAAAAILGELGDDYEAADTLDRIAAACTALGATEQAETVARQALALYLAQHRTAAAERIRQRAGH